MEHNFRAALNGFNRADVVSYIEECSINHARELRQLREENARLRSELEQLEAARVQPEPLPPAPEPPAPPEPAPKPEPAVSGTSAEELAAYRRAEAVERAARQRAAELCRQVNAVLAGAGRQFEASRGDVDALMSDLNICLRRLNDAFAQLRMAFDDTGSALSGIAPLDPAADAAPKG